MTYQWIVFPDVDHYFRCVEPQFWTKLLPWIIYLHYTWSSDCVVILLFEKTQPSYHTVSFIILPTKATFRTMSSTRWIQSPPSGPTMLESHLPLCRSNGFLHFLYKHCLFHPVYHRWFSRLFYCLVRCLVLRHLGKLHSPSSIPLLFNVGALSLLITSTNCEITQNIISSVLKLLHVSCIHVFTLVCMSSLARFVAWRCSTKSHTHVKYEEYGESHMLYCTNYSARQRYCYRLDTWKTFPNRSPLATSHIQFTSDVISLAVLSGFLCRWSV